MSGLREAMRPSRAPGATRRRAAVLPTSLRASWPTAATLLAWSLIGLAISAREGEWSPAALAALLVAFVLLVAVVASGRPLVPANRGLLAVPVLVSLLAATVHPVHRLMHVHGGGLVAIEVLAAVTVAAAFVTLTLPHRAARGTWPALAALGAVTGAVTIAVVPDPKIDVWYLLQQSAQGLLHGADMYRQHWQHSHGLQAVYPYLPWSTVLLAPFRWLVGDVRAGLLVATLLTGWQVRRLAPLAPPALAALVFVHPHWAFLVDQSWTEPLLLALLAAAVLGLSRERPGLAVVALAGALACKQHIVLLLPLFALWPGFGVRRAIGSAGLALLLVLPWLAWSPHDLWHDAVKANLDLGVLRRALCVPSLLLRHGIEVGFWFPLLLLAATYAVVVLRAPRSPSGLALGSATVLLALDLGNKQSFFNHYTLPLGLLVIAVAAAAPLATPTVSRTPMRTPVRAPGRDGGKMST